MLNLLLIILHLRLRRSFRVLVGILLLMFIAQLVLRSYITQFLWVHVICFCNELAMGLCSWETLHVFFELVSQDE